jgi:hypothetical protein
MFASQFSQVGLVRPARSFRVRLSFYYKFGGKLVWLRVVNRGKFQPAKNLISAANFKSQQAEKK